MGQPVGHSIGRSIKVDGLENTSILQWPASRFFIIQIVIGKVHHANSTARLHVHVFDSDD